MKKFLSAAVAFGLVAGAAATASAWEFSMTGKYKLDGYYIDQGMGYGMIVDAWDHPDAGTDDWYQHTFRIDPIIKVNDKVRVNMDIRLIDSNTIWGSQDDTASDNGANVDINKVWLAYDSPIGKIEVGRRPGGAWQYDFVSSSTNADRIMWFFPTSGALKGYAFLQKSAEVDAYVGGGDSDSMVGSGWSGEDSDYYEVAMGYQQDNVKGWLGLGTSQDDTTGAENNMWRIKGAGQFGMNDMTFLGEFDYKFGDRGSGATEMDYNSYALFLAMNMNMGNINATFGYATISGDSDTDNDLEAYDAAHGTGDDFEPLYILTGNRTNVLNGDAGGTNIIRQSGVHALVALADYKVSEDMSLHGGLGWGMADDEPAGFDDDYGWEVDLGMSYKLYQNLTYDLHFGYWFVGDFAELGGTASTEDVLLLSHHLTMKF